MVKNYYRTSCIPFHIQPIYEIYTCENINTVTGPS